MVSDETSTKRENLPPWRETPLDHWSKEIDPAIMAGDEWASQNPSEDPGAKRIMEKAPGTVQRERFMHPTHTTNWGVSDDRFEDKDE